MKQVEVRSQEDQLVKFIRRCQEIGIADREPTFRDIYGVNEEDLAYLIHQGGILYRDNVTTMVRVAKLYQALQFGQVVEGVLKTVEDTYPTGESLVVNIYPMTPKDRFGIERLGGVSGWVDWDGHTMGLVVHASPTSLLALRSTVVHEYHHHYRIMTTKLGQREIPLIEKLVREGMAEHFVEMLLGQKAHGPWVSALTAEEAQKLWRARYRGHLQDQGETADAYVFGGGDTGLPLWAGYSLGYFLVAWYRAAYPSLPMEELSRVAAEKFLDTVP